MGVSASPAAFAAKMATFGAAVAALPAAGTEAAALITKRSIEAARATAGASSGRLRGVGKKGRSIGVRYVVSPKAVESSAVVFATGPWPLLESDTPAHVIPKARGARARKRVVVVPGVGPRARAQHPGTQGKHPWAKGVVVAKPLATEAYEKGLAAEMTRIF